MQDNFSAVCPNVLKTIRIKKNFQLVEIILLGKKPNQNIYIANLNYLTPSLY